MLPENKNKLFWAIVTGISIFVSIPIYYTELGYKGIVLLGFIGIIMFFTFSRIKVIGELL